MATLFVEKVPDDLYQALRERARSRRHSIAAEVIALLEEHVPTAQELKARRAFLSRVLAFRSRPSRARRAFPSSEAMQREDRLR